MNYYQSVSDREDGFTLMELLVVILCIGILVAIAVPTLLSQRKLAHDAALKSDLRTVAVDYATWANTHTNSEYHAHTFLLREATYIIGKDAEFAMTPYNRDTKTGNAPLWKDITKNNINISEGSIVEIIVRKKGVTLDYTRGDKPLPEDQFCLTGQNRYSNYDHVINGGKTYTNPGGWLVKSLYYDSYNGGVYTIEELAEVDPDATGPCGNYAKAYRAKMGM